MADFYRQLLCQLLLLVPSQKFQAPSPEGPEPHADVIDIVGAILAGKAATVFTDLRYKGVFYNKNALLALDNYPETDLKTALNGYVDEIMNSMLQSSLADSLLVVQLMAVLVLQLFVQANFTGPSVDFRSEDLLLPHVDHERLHSDLIGLLGVEGQQAYELMNQPLLFVLSSLMLEKLMGIGPRHTFIGRDVSVTLEDLVEATAPLVALPDVEQASLFWWRSRALQVHISLLSEPPSLLTSISSLLLGPGTVKALLGDDAMLTLIQYSYLVETARASIHSYTEHMATSPLAQAAALTGLQMVLSGARAKRTKFQTFTTSSLILLAKSKGLTPLDEDASEEPAALSLDSDLLLEKPQYDTLEDIKEPNQKKLKFDDDENTEPEAVLLPIARHRDQIAPELAVLDPNGQPALNDLDNLQLLLRLVVLRQTSPANNPLVEEELMAIVSRVIYQPSKSVNWAIFGRGLWERSLLETSRARTVERGILQMTSLVEEIGIKIKTRVFQTADSTDASPAAARLRFIHQLPLMPQWTMDAKLAEKYMSLGVLRSALEIYERLHMVCEAALCYAAVENETEAERLLVARLDTHPGDARATSILGDIRQDPQLWEKAWEIGRYAKAKSSLSKYYYSPPESSGLARDLEAAMAHMNQCLAAEPLNFENWFFYGCCGLEAANFELASEAFTRCVSLDDTHSHSWSNLATALLRMGKTRAAFNALRKAMASSREGKRSWRIYENYIIVAMKLNEWLDVLLATRELLTMKDGGDASIDIPVIEKLVEILVATEFPPEGTRMTHYQSSCTELVCVQLPKVITTSARCWRLVARVHIWRRRPWDALDCYEKAYRAVSQKNDLLTDEDVWNEAVEACSDLVAAYESLGELPGKHGAEDVVCKDWKYKSKTTVRSLMSKGKLMWEDSAGWERLVEMKEGL